MAGYPPRCYGFLLLHNGGGHMHRSGSYASGGGRSLGGEGTRADGGINSRGRRRARGFSVAFPTEGDTAGAGPRALWSTSAVRVGQAPKLGLGEAVEVVCEGVSGVMKSAAHQPASTS